MKKILLIMMFVFTACGQQTTVTSLSMPNDQNPATCKNIEALTTTEASVTQQVIVGLSNGNQYAVTKSTVSQVAPSSSSNVTGTLTLSGCSITVSGGSITSQSFN